MKSLQTDGRAVRTVYLNFWFRGAKNLIIIWQAKHAWLEITGKLTKSYFLMFLSYSKIDSRILKWTHLDGRWSQLSVGDRDSGSPGTCPAHRHHCLDRGCQSKDCCKSCCLGSPLSPLRTLNMAFTIKVSDLQITFHSWLKNNQQLGWSHDQILWSPLLRRFDLITSKFISLGTFLHSIGIIWAWLSQIEIFF